MSKKQHQPAVGKKIANALKAYYRKNGCWNKGRKHTAQAKQNMSLGHIGLRRSKAGNKKHSESLKACYRRIGVSWNKGRKRSDEFKQKLSTANQGKVISAKQKAQISKAQKEHYRKYGSFHTGRKRSEETRRKMSAAQVGRTVSAAARRKMSLSHMGKKLSEETRQKMSLQRQGADHPNWRGGTSNEPYNASFNREFKAQIWKRDGFTCQICYKTGVALHVHHISYIKKDDRPENLTSLCISCHMKTNYNRDFWQAYFTYRIRRDYTPEASNSRQDIVRTARISKGAEVIRNDNPPSVH